VVDEQLRAAIEQLGQRPLAVLSVESILRLDPHPGQLAPLLRQLIAPPRELLLLPQQFVALGLPFLLGGDSELGHCGAFRLGSD
jgi:hypothetical protein